MLFTSGHSVNSYICIVLSGKILTAANFCLDSVVAIYASACRVIVVRLGFASRVLSHLSEAQLSTQVHYGTTTQSTKQSIPKSGSMNPTALRSQVVHSTGTISGTVELGPEGHLTTFHDGTASNRPTGATGDARTAPGLSHIKFSLAKWNHKGEDLWHEILPRQRTS